MRNIFLILFLSVCIMLYSSYDSFFNDEKVQEIVTIGNLNYANEKKIVENLNQLLGDEIYKIDLRVIKKNIEKNPWIKSVQVSIEKPNKLLVKLIEFQPLYIWNNKKYVDSDGNVIEYRDKLIDNLLKLNSNDNSPQEMYQVYIKIQKILEDLNLRVLQLDRDLDILIIETDKYNFLVNFIIFERKLLEFSTIYDQFLSKSKNLKDIKNIDLRYPTGFAVQ